MSHNASRGSKLSINELNSCLFWLFWHNLSVAEVWLPLHLRRDRYFLKDFWCTQMLGFPVQYHSTRQDGRWQRQSCCSSTFHCLLSDLTFYGVWLEKTWVQFFQGFLLFFLHIFLTGTICASAEGAVWVGANVWTEGSKEHNCSKSVINQMQNYSCD